MGNTLLFKNLKTAKLGICKANKRALQMDKPKSGIIDTFSCEKFHRLRKRTDEHSEVWLLALKSLEQEAFCFLGKSSPENIAAVAPKVGEQP